MSFLDVYAIVLLAYFMASIIRAIRTLAAYSRDAKSVSYVDANGSPGQKIYVLVPLFEEAKIAEKIVANFANELGDMGSVSIYFCVHDLDVATAKSCTEAVARRTESNIGLVVNRTHSHSKASQLNAAIELLLPELTAFCVISVFDADSLPDRRIVSVIRQWQHQAVNSICDGALQQAPFYPIVVKRSLLGSIAQGRAIHSLVYHYCYECPAYRATCRSSIAMSIHLTGHGEHILFHALKAAGGFREPSCDSSLGFALSYLNYSITPIPIPDLCQTPETLKDVWSQGLRWYRGCDLYWRELWRLGITPSRVIKALLTLANNLRWFLIWPVTLLLLIFSWPIELVVSQTVLTLCVAACYARHIVMYLAYRQLAHFSNATTPPPGFRYWATTAFLSYVTMRVLWCFPPLQFYLQKMLRVEVVQASTPKSGLMLLRSGKK